MSGGGHAQPMRLVDHHLDQVHRQELVDLDEIVTELLLSLYRLAGFLRRGDDDVAAHAARAWIIGLRPPTADGETGRANPRAANLSERRSVPLRNAPGTILEDFDGHARGDTEMQV